MRSFTEWLKVSDSYYGCKRNNIHGKYQTTDNYLAGKYQPHYPMPAIRTRTFDSLVKLGHSSAENNFPIDIVFENYIKY